MRKAMQAFFVIALALALAIATFRPTPAPAQQDPAGLFRQFADAINRGDVDGALALFTDDATWERGGECPPGACVGKAAIRPQLEQDVANHHRIDVTDVQVSGNTLTARIELRTDGTRAAGIERIIQSFTLQFAADKITSLRAAPDTTDPQTAARQGSGRLPGTGGPPPMGQAPGVPLILLLAGGAALLSGGLLTTLALRRGTRKHA